MAKVSRKCANKKCGATFTARSADVKRGWARFCSKSCKASEQEGRTHQNRNYHNNRDAYHDGGLVIPSMESGYLGHGQE